MNKRIEKVESYKKKILNQALEKLKAEYAEAEDFYRDTGYDRYFKKMQKCEAELQEIEEYLCKDEVVTKDLSTEQYREYLKMKQDLTTIKNKLFYLVTDLGLPVTADLTAIQDILKDYN